MYGVVSRPDKELEMIFSLLGNLQVIHNHYQSGSSRWNQFAITQRSFFYIVKK